MKLTRPFWDISLFGLFTPCWIIFLERPQHWCVFFNLSSLASPPFLRVGDLEQGVRVGQKGTAQMFVHPPTTTLELENDREYKIQMETC